MSRTRPGEMRKHLGNGRQTDKRERRQGTLNKECERHMTIKRGNTWGRVACQDRETDKIEDGKELKE